MRIKGGVLQTNEAEGVRLARINFELNARSEHTVDGVVKGKCKRMMRHCRNVVLYRRPNSAQLNCHSLGLLANTFSAACLELVCTPVSHSDTQCNISLIRDVLEQERHLPSEVVPSAPTLMWRKYTVWKVRCVQHCEP